MYVIRGNAPANHEPLRVPWRPPSPTQPLPAWSPKDRRPRQVGRDGGFDSRPRRMVSLIILGTGLLASIVGVATVGTMLYFALMSYRRDHHSPGGG